MNQSNRSGIRMKLYLFLLFCVLLTGESSAVERRVMGNDFERGLHGWKVWNAGTGVLTHRNGSALLVPSAGRKRVIAGSGFGIRELDGMRFNWSMRVRGTGSVRFGIFTYEKDASGTLKRAAAPEWGPFHQLSGDWMTLSLSLDFSERSVYDLSFLLELTGEGNLQLEFDDHLVMADSDSGNSLEMVSCPPFRKGDTLPDVVIRTAAPEQECMIFGIDNSRMPIKMKSKLDSLLTIPGKLLWKNTEGGFSLAIARKGNVLRLHENPLSEQEYERLDETAKKIHLEHPLKIVYIGDSLYDFDRGHNAADGVHYWLEKYNSRKIAFFNASVRGDDILSVEARLKRNKKVRRPDAYDAFSSLSPNLVFLMLGHNDTKASSQDGFSSPAIPPEIQKKTYLNVIRILQKNWPDAKIVLVSGTSPDTVFLKEKAQRELKKNGRAYRFGDPEKLEAYNAVLKKIAEEKKLDYLDYYNTMKALPREQKKRLLRENDGLHMKNAGYIFLTMELLKYLSIHL